MSATPVAPPDFSASPDPFRLDGRTALVVGTSPNIGAGIALELARAGARVACVDRDEKMSGRVAAEIVERGGDATGFACDVTLPEDVDATVRKVEDDLGLVDVLVNGAVVYAVRGVLDMAFEDWRRQLAVMLDGAFLFTRRVATALIADGRPGCIVNIISTAGHQGEPSNIGYTTAKGGLLNMTRSAAMELAPYGIRVNSLTPTATDLSEAADRHRRWGLPELDPALLSSIAVASGQAPLGRLPGPSDYGRGVVFLASDAAALVTGSDLRVDAGTLAMYWRRKPPGGP